MAECTFERAVELEEVAAEDALACYRQLQRQNTKLHRDILLAAAACPVLASVIAFLVGRAVEGHQALITVAIVAGLGFFPPVMMFQYRFLQLGFKHPGWPLMLAFAAWLVFLTLLGEVLVVAVLLLHASVVVAVLILPLTFVLHLLVGTPANPNEWPLYITVPTLAPVMLLVVLFDLSEARLLPVVPLKRLLVDVAAGLRCNSKRILRLLASVGVGVVLAGSGLLGLLYDHLYESLVAAGFAGAMLGSASRLEKDPLLTNLIRLGQARCLLLMRRTAEVDCLLKDVLDSPSFSRPEAVEYLARAIGALQAGGQCSYELNLAAGSQLDRYQDIWLSSYSRTRLMAGFEKHHNGEQPQRAIERILSKESLGAPSSEATAELGVGRDKSKYLGIGRVLATGYTYQKDVPRREYDADNPTGYMTGQWIDVQVLEGVMEFNGAHHRGDVIRGVWSHGGDVGIVGKPEAGDIVGYHRDAYCQVWEKLERVSESR